MATKRTEEFKKDAVRCWKEQPELGIDKCTNQRDEEIMEAMRQNNGYNIEPVNQLLQLVFSIYFCKNKNAANRIKLSFQHFLGWAIHLNSQQLVGESNPCFRRERAAS